MIDHITVQLTSSPLTPLFSPVALFTVAGRGNLGRRTHLLHDQYERYIRRDASGWLRAQGRTQKVVSLLAEVQAVQVPK